jgi:hypothetical protein
MAENKKSVLLYCDIIHTVEELDDVDAGLLFKHYLRYINDQDPEPPSKLIKIVFEPIKQTLKRDLKKWKSEIKQRSDAGKKGMFNRWHNKDKTVITNNNNVINPITKITDSVKDIVKDKVSESGNTLTLGSGKNFFSVTTKYATDKAYIVKGVDGLKEYMELNKSILDFPDQHERFMREVNGDVFNEFMHVKNRFKKFIEKQYA